MKKDFANFKYSLHLQHQNNKIMKKFLTAMSIILGLGLAQAQHTQAATTVTTPPPTKALKVEKQKVEKKAAKIETSAKKEAAKVKESTNKTGLKLKKDGTVDKRFKENKHLKKDGTPDKRYKEHKK